MRSLAIRNGLRHAIKPVLVHAGFLPNDALVDTSYPRPLVLEVGCCLTQ
jgi:hypothetical protein